MTTRARRLGPADAALAADAIRRVNLRWEDAAPEARTGPRPGRASGKKDTAGVEGFGEEYLRRFLAKPENLLIVAGENGSTAGFLLAYALDRVAAGERRAGRNDRDRRMFCVYEIGVVAASRRRGLAKAMIEERKAWCRREHVMKAWVVTDRRNEAAMRLYASAKGRPGAGDDVVFVWNEEA